MKTNDPLALLVLCNGIVSEFSIIISKIDCDKLDIDLSVLLLGSLRQLFLHILKSVSATDTREAFLLLDEVYESVKQEMRLKYAYAQT